MSDKKPENPLAFPMVDTGLQAQEGMTLRDWFAGMVLEHDVQTQPKWIAKKCYEIADAMLKERGKNE